MKEARASFHCARKRSSDKRSDNCSGRAYMLGPPLSEVISTFTNRKVHCHLRTMGFLRSRLPLGVKTVSLVIFEVVEVLMWILDVSLYLRVAVRRIYRKG